MSEKRVIYKTEDGSVAIIVPTPDCLQYHTIEEIAEKDVPEGVPYKIVDVSEIPSDRTFRNAWEIDESELTDGVGGAITSFDEVQNGN
jgi:hypothetical protein